MRALNGPASEPGPADRVDAGEALSRLDVLLGFHRSLLRDRRRMAAFDRALGRAVSRGASVLDIGSGTGIWAVRAAQRGAARVVAVEREELLVPLIRRLAADNGVAGVVEVRLGDSRSLDLGERFDVVVSETIGNQAFDEEVVPVMADARARLLRPEGRLVPQAVRLLAAPATAPEAAPEEDTCGVRLDVLRALSLHFPRLAGRRPLRLAARPAVLAEARLGEPGPVAVSALSATFEVGRREAVDALATWAEIDLAPGVRLDTLGTTSWRPVCYPLPRAGPGPGRLSVRVTLDPPRSLWEAEWDGGGPVAASPLFAYGAVMAMRRSG